MRNVTIPRDAWELDRLPDHLTVTFRVVDERGREVARGTDLEKLRHELAPKVREELATAGADIEATGLTTWSIGTLPREIGLRRGPHVVTGYPGLVDRGTSVDVRVFPTAAERDPAHRRGVRRLLLLETPSPARAITREPGQRRAAGHVPHPARLARQAARRLRHGVRRRADHRRRRAGVGRGVVREAARGDPGEAGVDDRPGARRRPCRADRLAPGAGADRRPDRAGARGRAAATSPRR